VLVFLDTVSRRKEPLSSLVSDTSPLLEAAMVVVLVTLAVMGGLLPESTAIGPVSPMSLAIVVFFLIGVLGINRARRRPAWSAVGDAPPTAEEAPNRFNGRLANTFGLIYLVVILVVAVSAIPLMILSHQGQG
jgi:cytochrome b561